MSKVGIIVQARMGSQRLAGKVLKEVRGKPLLEYQIERLRRVSLADELIVATTTSARDLSIVNICNHLEVPIFRGSEDDVLSRYYDAAKVYHLDTVVRVTADCPLIDPVIVDQVIRRFQEGAWDYVSNTLKRRYPRGMDTEVFAFEALQKSHQEAKAKPDREHVTPYIYRNPSCFKLGEVVCDDDLSGYRWTVDTEDDFQLIRKMLEALYPSKMNFTLKDCLDLLSEHPDWHLINAHVCQKKYGES